MVIRLHRARRAASFTLARPDVRGFLAGLVVLLLAAAAVIYGVALWKVPDWMGLKDSQDRHNARLLVISVGGAAVVAVSLLYTARSYRLSHRGQVTDRFTKALERLSSPDLDARLGGIYALAHVANDSRPHHDDVIEVLEAFIRRRAPARRPDRMWLHEPELPPRPDADVQAALTVLGRRPRRPERRMLDLSSLHLAGARLSDLDLSGAKLDGTNLTGALMLRVNLRHANLRHANLRDAKLTGADLSEADLAYADLQGANLRHMYLPYANLAHSTLGQADLTDVDLNYANLDGADLRQANLSYAELTEANLTDAQLTRADLSGARLAGAMLPPQTPSGSAT